MTRRCAWTKAQVYAATGVAPADSGPPTLEVRPKERALWEAWLVNGRPPLRTVHVLLRGLLGGLPGYPRCKLCNRPLGGPFGAPLTVLGFGPSRKNPSLCDFCFERLPLGGAEVDVAVLFADVRGSTALAEGASPAAFAALMGRFYRVATGVLLAHGALIDKLVGDEVVALFVRGLSGPTYRRLAATAGEALLRAAGHGSERGPWLAIGVGVHVGAAFVGNVGSGGVADFTALGDTVNVAARLQATAAAGELVLSDEAYRTVADIHPDLERRSVSIRGRAAPVEVRILRPTGR